MKKLRQIVTVILILITIPLSSLAENYGAIILQDNSTVKFFKDGRKIFREEITVKITGKKGIKEFGEVVIPFSSEHQRVKILYAYTVTPDGKVVKPSKKAFNVVYPPFVSEAPIYSDLKYQTISMPAVTKGAILKYGYEVETFKPYMKNEFWTTNFFQGEYPVKEAIFTALLPKEKSFKYKCYNMSKEECKPIEKEEKDFKVLKWKLEKVPPIVPEPSMPPMGEVAKKVSITSIKKWDTVAKWYSELAKEAVKPTKPIVELAKKLTEKKKTEEEKIRAIYNFVAQNIRYVGLEFGINGYKPHKAEEVLRNRYGDCKDHATLLVSMLKAVGIKAYPVLIPTSSKSNMDPELPTPTAFNHEIAAVKLKGKLLFMDTTSDFVPFKLLPPGDQGRRVLIVDVEKEEGKVEETPVFPAETNVEGFKGTFLLKERGELEGDFTYLYKGVYGIFERARLNGATEKEIERHVENLASKVSPGFTVEKYSLSNYKDLNSPEVWVRIKGKDENYGTVTSHFFLLKLPSPSFSRLVSLVSQEKRNYPYVIGYKFLKDIRVKVKLPRNYDLYLKPEDFVLKNRVGEVKVCWNLNGKEVVCELKMKVNKHVIPPDEYRDLRELFNTFVKVIRNEVLVLKRKER